MSLMVAQFGQFSRASKFSGRSFAALNFLSGSFLSRGPPRGEGRGGEVRGGGREGEERRRREGRGGEEREGSRKERRMKKKQH